MNMSMHKKPLTELEREGLIAHGLDIGTPSQLSDVFRQGIAFALANAPTVHREGWVSVEDRLPDQLELKIKLIDGSEIYAWYQSDGDYYWNCGGREIFIDESNVTYWQPLPAAPTDTE